MRILIFAISLLPAERSAARQRPKFFEFAALIPDAPESLLGLFGSASSASTSVAALAKNESLLERYWMGLANRALSFAVQQPLANPGAWTDHLDKRFLFDTVKAPGGAFIVRAHATDALGHLAPENGNADAIARWKTGFCEALGEGLGLPVRPLWPDSPTGGSRSVSQKRWTLGLHAPLGPSRWVIRPEDHSALHEAIAALEARALSEALPRATRCALGEAGVRVCAGPPRRL